MIPALVAAGRNSSTACPGKQNSTASRHGAAGISETLRKALEGRQFSSLEEAQAFVNHIARQRNRQPVDEFHGLSPKQVHWILDLPFSSPELVHFSEALDANPVAPALTLFELLTDAIGEEGLKLTARGNLPRNFCREAALTYLGDQKYGSSGKLVGRNISELQAER